MYFRNWQKAISALTCLCLVANLVGPNALLADSSGPSSPGAAICSGGNNSRGPCTDPGTFTSVGIGNGSGGMCGNIVWIYSGGTCAGTDNFSGNNCNECTITPKMITYTYTSTPVGALAMAGCKAMLNGAFPIRSSACAAACTTNGVLSSTPECLECIEGESDLGAVIVEAYRECIEDCSCTGFVPGGVTTACN